MKKLIEVLRDSVYYNFLIDGRFKNSNLDISSKILNTFIWLRKVFNIGADIEIEIFTNNQTYHENNKILLNSLGFDPETNIIEVKKDQRISNDSKVLECTLDNKNKQYQEIIRFNLVSLHKLSFIFNIFVENFKTFKMVLIEALYYRLDKTDNPYEQEIVQKILSEIEEISDNYLAKLLSKLERII